MRIETHKCVRLYFEECKKIHPMREILLNTSKYGLFAKPITTYREDCGVKMTVNLQLMYKTIDSLGTEDQNVFK